MSFLRELLNTISMTMEVTPERLKEIQQLVKSWLGKNEASLKEVQSVL